MAAYTTEKLLTSINLKAFVPTGQKTFSPEEILTIADEVTATKLCPSILKIREEYFVTYIDYDIIAGQAAYPIPDRAIGMIAREIKVYNTSSQQMIDLSRIDLTKINSLQGSANTPSYFYLQNNNIILTPMPSVTQNVLRVWYYIRAGELIPSVQAAMVTAIDTVSNTVTVNATPSTWVTGQVFDLISGSGSHDYRAIDLTSMDVSGGNITLSSLPSELKVGDFITPQGLSPVVQLPSDYRPVLATFVAAEMLRVQGMDTADVVEAKAQQLLIEGQQMITPRVVGEDVIILPDWS